MAVPVTRMPAPSSEAPEECPPLRQGDRLTREEFERRYDAMPELKRAELIGGIVYLPSPVRTDQHGRPHAHVVGWLSVYVVHTPGVEISDNGSVRMDDENMPQPDVQLFLDPACGGQARLDESGYVEGAPELIVEVSASSTAFDLNEKKRAYLQNGVREYVVLRVLEGDVLWFCLRGDQYEPSQPDEAGIYRSEIFPGLWLDSVALFRGDWRRVHEVLHQGLATSEHSIFAERTERALNP